MDATTVTVLVGGWWLPGRHLAAGDTLTLDTATAEALARRGIVRIDAADAPPVAPNVSTPQTQPSNDQPAAAPRRRKGA